MLSKKECLEIEHDGWFGEKKPKAKLRVLAISDLHGLLPELPETDLLVIAGDIAPDNKYTLKDNHLCAEVQAHWLNGEFTDWLMRQPAKHRVAIWGNHDFVGQLPNYRFPQRAQIHLLRDSGVTIEGKRIWGSPWVTNIPRWAMNVESTEDVWAYAPHDLNLLVTHAPPKGTGDFLPGWGFVGDKDLAAALPHLMPKVHVFGHIHEGVGAYQLGPRVAYNVAYVDDRYEPNGHPFRQFEI